MWSVSLFNSTLKKSNVVLIAVSWYLIENNLVNSMIVLMK